MRKIMLMILTLLLCIGMMSPVSVMAAEDHPDRFVDKANLLTEKDGIALESRLDKISEELGCDVAIVTVESLGSKTSQAYADDYFDNNGYGMGPKDDGVLLLISMECRDWAISTHGFGITAFTDAGLAYIMEWVTPNLTGGNYAKAFDTYAEYCEEFITKAKNGKPYDKSNMPSPNTSKPYLIWLIPSVILGAVIGALAMFSKKATLGEIKYRAKATEYVTDAKIENEYNQFLYRDYKRMYINTYMKYSDTAGGSTVHRSASGSMHGGASGKF